MSDITAVNPAAVISVSPIVPRLTIVIPTVNRASMISRAIDSALAQTYPDIEIIVSNNGSIDATRAVLDRYIGTPRLRIIHIEKTISAVHHGNFLLEQARGEFFLGLSDDDWIEPQFTEKVVNLFDRRPGLSFVWTGSFIHYADIVVPARIGPEVEHGQDFLAGFLRNQRNICWCACVTRTADLRRIGPIPDNTICGDMFYWTKLAGQGDIGCVPEPVSHYVCYRDSNDGIAGGTQVLIWGQEVEALTRDMLIICEKAYGNSAAMEAVRREAVEFVASSTANQFVWNALRGTSLTNLLRALQPALPYIRYGHPRNWIRVIASFIRPRWLLRNRVLAEAARKSRMAVSIIAAKTGIHRL
jgi:glycosyltransferase involved in cell wall biosynthesis